MVLLAEIPNSLQRSAICSPASRRATNCSLSSITEHSFQGITPSQKTGGSFTHVSGTMCYLCLRPLIIIYLAQETQKIDLEKKMTMPLSGRQAESAELAPYGVKVQQIFIPISRVSPSPCSLARSTPARP